MGSRCEHEGGIHYIDELMTWKCLGACFATWSNFFRLLLLHQVSLGLWALFVSETPITATLSSKSLFMQSSPTGR